MLFKFLELEHKNNNIKNAEYYHTNNIVSSNENYIIEIESIPVGIYISDFLDIELDDLFFKFLKKQITISQNRGDVAGVVDIDKTIQNLNRKLKFFEDENIIKEVNKLLFAVEDNTESIL